MISHKEIIKRFPRIFSGHCNYIECENGWNNIILCLCELLNCRYVSDVQRLKFLSAPRTTSEETEHFLKKHQEEIEKLTKNLAGGGHYPIAAQIKEKFGSLRAYIDCCNDEEYAYCIFAEQMSERTCAGCGNPGDIKSGGWLRCSCDKCEK